MGAHTVGGLVSEFKSVNSELLKSVDSGLEIDMSSWMKKRSSIATRIFDHLQEKTGFKAEEVKTTAKNFVKSI